MAVDGAALSASRARDAALALCFVFEPRTCRAVVPLLDELPRLPTTEGKAARWIDSLASLVTLEEAGYITIEKSFVGRKPLTRARITRAGCEAFRRYLLQLATLVERGLKKR
ncbi:MAG TPA: transcriptional regulator [Steroidobacteraceae bacterium]